MKAFRVKARRTLSVLRCSEQTADFKVEAADEGTARRKAQERIAAGDPDIIWKDRGDDGDEDEEDYQIDGVEELPEEPAPAVEALKAAEGGVPLAHLAREEP